MKIMITGHREHKLYSYNLDEIKNELYATIDCIKNFKGSFIGISGMASGVDLWFCEAMLELGMNYWAYIPFDEQCTTMLESTAKLREKLLSKALKIVKTRNSQMIEDCDAAIVIFDGNKGGTANCFQQLLEIKKPFWWINPIDCRVYHINQPHPTVCGVC